MQKTKYKYAGYWPRMWAYNTDLVILLGVFYCLSWLISDNRILHRVCFLFTWIYHAAFESSRLQATPGKKILGLKVINEDGKGLSLKKAMGRFLLKVVSLAIFYIGFIMIGFSKKGQGLHDKILHTVVVRTTDQD